MGSAVQSGDIKYRRNWGAALTAVRALLKDPNDTLQVFRIMQALNGASSRTGYLRLLKTAEGGRIAYRRPELIERLRDRAWLNRFAPGTVGAAYCAFLDKTGYSADGLADVSRQEAQEPDREHPYAWFGRRIRDEHDIWHVLTGYKADQPLGEACLVAFSYAQTGGLGWAFIALAAALKDFRKSGGRAIASAIWEGYRNGRRAAWLAGEDIEALFAEDIDAARARLKIARAGKYELAQRAAGKSGEATFAMGVGA